LPVLNGGTVPNRTHRCSLKEHASHHAFTPRNPAQAAPSGYRSDVRGTKSADNGLAGMAVPLAVLGIVMAMIAPMPPFLLDVLISANITISVVVLLVSMYITRAEASDVPPAQLSIPRDSLESVFKVEPLAVEVGLGLVKLVEGGQNSPPLRRIAGIREQMATELGNLVWIPAESADNARSKGYTVVDPVGVLATHLTELVRRHAHELLSRQDTKIILDRVGKDNGENIEDLVPKLLPLSSVQKVFQNLLRERVSVRDAVNGAAA
jgi:flagellar biosynthesis component FlhA